MLRLLVVVTVALSFAPNNAFADLIFYGDRSAFNNATYNRTLIDFESPAANFYSTPPGLTLSGVNFNIDHTGDTGGALFVISAGWYAPTQVLSSQQSTNGPNNLVITFSSAQTAIGADISSFYGSLMTIYLSSGESWSFNPTDFWTGLAFGGFTSTVGITGLRIEQSNTDVMIIDNFVYGSVVPVPSGVVLSGIGFVACSIFYKRFKGKGNLQVS